MAPCPLAVTLLLLAFSTTRSLELLCQASSSYLQDLRWWCSHRPVCAWLPGSSVVSSKCQLSPPSPFSASPEFQLQENFWWAWDSVWQCLKQSTVLGLHLPKPVLNRSDLYFLILKFLGENPPISRKSSRFCFYFCLFLKTFHIWGGDL